MTRPPKPKSRARPTALLAPTDPQALAVLDACPLALIMTDAEYRLVYVNQAALELAGKSGDQVVGLPVAEALGAAAWAAIRPLAERVIAGEAVTSAGWVPYPGGRRYVMRNYAPVRDRKGKVLGGFGYIQDLTAQFEAELRAAETERLKSAVVDSALDCVVAIDETGAIIEFNPAAERTFGWQRADVLGRQISDVIVPPQHRGAHAAGFANYLATDQAKILGRRIEIEAQRADGRVIPVELTVNEVRLPDRRIFTAYLRDLTERRNAEAELARQREALHQSQTMAAMGSLLASVAHELNNPLAIVLGQATMLAEEASGTPMARRADRVREAADRSASIVRTFLAMARQRPPARQPVDLGEVCRAAVRLLEYGLRADGIVLSVRIDAEVPPIEGDADQLHQVIANLVINAQHALRGRAGRRELHLQVGAEGDETVRVTLDDSGPGIAPEIAGRIFEPFFTTKQTGQGTGIGLSVSRSLITAHGGTIACEPSPLGGARFVIRLPRSVGAPCAPLGAPAPEPAPSGLHALVVDDEVEIAAMLAEIVEAAGWSVVRAIDGRDALRRLKRGRFDAVFADLRMPDLDGRALIDWIATERPDLTERVVMVTGDVLSLGDLSSRVGHVLEKPFRPAEIRRILGELAAATPLSKPKRRRS